MNEQEPGTRGVLYATTATAGYVQFTMNCGGYKGKITARVFPNLSKECILGMPWLVQENPIIDWKWRQVTIQRSGSVITLPIVRNHYVKSIIETVNLCSAKQVERWFRRQKVDQAYLGFTRLVKDEKGAEDCVCGTGEDSN